LRSSRYRRGEMQRPAEEQFQDLHECHLDAISPACGGAPPEEVVGDVGAETFHRVLAPPRPRARERAAVVVLGCSVVTCRIRFHRAKRRLAAQLTEFEDDPAEAPTRPHLEGATQ
jgi:hypothetical protein